MRPKNCVLVGSSGTHSVCVCTIHQNFKLMLNAIDIENLTRNTDTPIFNYKNCMKQMICRNPRLLCYLGECGHCPDTDEISQNLMNLLEEACISNIEYSAWTGTDRSTLRTLNVEIDDFIEELCSALMKLKLHSFILKKQTVFITGVKNQLCDGEVIVMFDFSENYKYVNSGCLPSISL